jgi:hypothetical protein
VNLFDLSLGQMSMIYDKNWVHVQIMMRRVKNYAEILATNYSKEKTHCVATVG